MGIKNFNNIFKIYIDAYTTVDVPQTCAYKVVVDGNLILHKGIYKDTVDCDQVAFNAFDYLSRTLRTLRTRCPVHSVAVYFDGVSPNMKMGVQKSRKRVPYKVNIKSSIARFQELCDETDMSTVKLAYGESELEMILDNYREHPLVLVTSDTDVFHVAYKRCTDHPLYLYNNGKFVDLSRFSVGGLSRNVFSMIIILMGTDYSQSFLTATMIKAILFAAKVSSASLEAKFRTIDAANLERCDEWRAALVALFDILDYSEFVLNFKVYGRAKRKAASTAASASAASTCASECTIDTILEGFAWLHAYYNRGRHVDNYTNNYESFVELSKEDQCAMIKTLKRQIVAAAKCEKNYTDSPPRSESILTHFVDF